MKKIKREWFNNWSLVILALLIGVSLVAASFIFWNDYFRKSMRRKRADLKKIFTQKKVTPPEVNLSFRPKNEFFQVEKDFEIEVVLDSQDKEVWGVELKLVFDPQFLMIKKVSTGKYFQEPLQLENLIDQEKREIWFSVGSLTPAQGKGVVAVLTVRPLQEGETALSFLPKTQVALKEKREPARIAYQDFSFSILK